MASKEQMASELATLKASHEALQAKLAAFEGGLIEQVVKATLKTMTAKDPIKAEVLWKLRRTRREFVCRKILDQLTEAKDLAELKYHIVDLGGYCSKATFYRYISEMGKKGMLSALQQGSTTIVAKA